MFGVLMEYHLVFIMLSFVLFFASIIFIWLWGTKQSVITAILFLSINQLFCIICEVGFLAIGIIGYNASAGETTVIQYLDMNMFFMLYLGMLWLNGLTLFIAIYKYMMIVYKEQMKGMT